MKRAIIVGMLMVVLALSGCAWTRQTIVDLSRSDVKNMEAVKEASRNLITTWPMYSGLIQGYFQNDIEKLPGEFVKALHQLDTIACSVNPAWYPEGLKENPFSCPDEGQPLTDWELGYSLALRIYMLKETVREILRSYAPDLLEFLPVLVGFS